MVEDCREEVEWICKLLLGVDMPIPTELLVIDNELLRIIGL